MLVRTQILRNNAVTVSSPTTNTITTTKGGATKGGVPTNNNNNNTTINPKPTPPNTSPATSRPTTAGRGGGLFNPASLLSSNNNNTNTSSNVFTPQDSKLTMQMSSAAFSSANILSAKPSSAGLNRGGGGGGGQTLVKKVTVPTQPVNPLTQTEIESATHLYYELESVNRDNLHDVLQQLNVFVSTHAEEEATRRVLRRGEYYFSLNGFLTVLTMLKHYHAENVVDDVEEEYVFRAMGGSEDRGGEVQTERLADVFRAFALDVDLDDFVAGADDDGSGSIDFSEFKKLFHREQDPVEKLLIAMSEPDPSSGSRVIALPKLRKIAENSGGLIPATVMERFRRECCISDNDLVTATDFGTIAEMCRIEHNKLTRLEHSRMDLSATTAMESVVSKTLLTRRLSRRGSLKSLAGDNTTANASGGYSSVAALYSGLTNASMALMRRDSEHNTMNTAIPNNHTKAVLNSNSNSSNPQQQQQSNTNNNTNNPSSMVGSQHDMHPAIPYGFERTTSNQNLMLSGRTDRPVDFSNSHHKQQQQQHIELPRYMLPLKRPTTCSRHEREDRDYQGVPYNSSPCRSPRKLVIGAPPDTLPPAVVKPPTVLQPFHLSGMDVVHNFQSLHHYVRDTCKVPSTARPGVKVKPPQESQPAFSVRRKSAPFDQKEPQLFDVIKWNEGSWVRHVYAKKPPSRNSPLKNRAKRNTNNDSGDNKHSSVCPCCGNSMKSLKSVQKRIDSVTPLVSLIQRIGKGFMTRRDMKATSTVYS